MTPAVGAAPSPLRILITDDHAMVRTGLRMLIEQEPHLRVIGEAGDLTTAVGLAAREQPHIILLDLDMGGQNGLDVMPDLFAAAKATRVLVLTGIRDLGVHRDAVRRGALGILLKDQAADVLIKAIEKVQAGEAWIDRRIIGHVLGDIRKQAVPENTDPEEVKIATLTHREREVLNHVSQGLKNHEIAARLFISDHTVRHYICAIYAKLGVSGRLDLILYAYQHHLGKPPRAVTV
jgi:two-component system, NarL family, nitrate/nitrite response regulator NarL